ncbi:2-dehydro-3-deoxy-6-phosphogalactonate aldolase [Sphingomonas sp.]|uniref:2-dehydro-3-deoxy-6-phosphogalactonate aldolase n=1 Tax=Sphingomonas sp. TaxID=28214 RepID=UPI00286B20EE|nr:2-dehydro-3-deoxy-6-phosphogalactonate aldolase [Sphingomonas sp.]
MTPTEDFRQYLDACPLIGILRGVTPDEAEAIGAAIFDAGIRIIEVPLNSPDPFKSIQRLADSLGDRALVGAGTVLEVGQVAEVKAAGGRLIVSPNTDATIIHASVAAGLISSPGFFTPSEAFTAIHAGAHTLKLFPAEAATPAVIKAQRAVLPRHIPLVVVGGIRADNMLPWLEAGADGCGLGSGLYSPGQSPAVTAEKARAFVAGLGC